MEEWRHLMEQKMNAFSMYVKLGSDKVLICPREKIRPEKGTKTPFWTGRNLQEDQIHMGGTPHADLIISGDDHTFWHKWN